MKLPQASEGNLPHETEQCEANTEWEGNPSNVETLRSLGNKIELISNNDKKSTMFEKQKVPD